MCGLSEGRGHANLNWTNAGAGIACPKAHLKGFLMRASLFALTGLALFALPALAQDIPPVKTEDLGSGIYALSNDRAGNIGVLVGEDGVFMIDTQMAVFAPSIEEAVKAVSDGRAVDLVLDTHLHGDHVGGNAYFAERGATIMAHANVRPGLMRPVTSQLTGSTPEPLDGKMLPTVAVDDGDAVMMNGQIAHFYHAPDAHTNGDLFVFFEEADIIHAGDLMFHRRFPYIDLDNGGSVDGYIAGMQMISDIAHDDTVIISGHGPLSYKADVDASIAMLTDAKVRVQALVDQGMDMEAVKAANPLADYDADWNWAFITTERMVWTLYRDITGKTE